MAIADEDRGPGARGGGTGGLTRADGLSKRQFSALAERAFTNGWPMDVGERRAVIEQLLTDAIQSASPRERTGAARALIAADLVNARREHTAIQERQGDVQSALAALRTFAASDPKVLDLYAQLSARLAAPPDTPAHGPPPDGPPPDSPAP